MIVNIKIGEQRTRLRAGWESITIAAAAKLAAIERPEDADQENPKWSKAMANFAAACFQVLTTDAIDTRRVNPLYIEQYYRAYIHPVIVDLHSLEPKSYRVRGIQRFRHNGTTYRLPEPLRIADGYIPGFRETAETYTEAADLTRIVVEKKGEGIDMLAALCATISRKRKEPFTEEMQIKRTEQFMSLPMSVAWECFFLCYKSIITLETDFISHVLGLPLGKKKPRRRLPVFRISATVRAFIGWLNRVWLGLWKPSKT